MYILSLFLRKIIITIVEMARKEIIEPTTKSYLGPGPGPGPGEGAVQHVDCTHSSTFIRGILEQF